MVLYFLKNFIFLLLLNVLIKPIWVFLIDIPVQNAVGHEEYGLYFTAFNFAYIFSILADLGINHYNNIHLADKSIEKNFSLASVLPFKVFVSFIYILITSIFAFFVFESSTLRYFVVLTSLFHSFTSILLFLRTYLSSNREFRNDSFFSVFDKLISTVLMGVVIYIFKDFGITIQHFIFIQIGSLLFVIAVLLFVLRGSWSFRIDFLTGDLSWIRDAIPYTLLILLMGIYTRVDSTLIQLLLDEKEAGIYAASYRLLDFLSQFGYLSSVILLPLFSSLKSESDKASSLFSNSSILLMSISLVISFVMVVFAADICRALYRDNSSEITLIFQLHLIAFPIVVTNFIVGSYITAYKYIRYLLFISIIGVGIQMLGNLLLLKSMGLRGAALVMLATQLWILISQLAWIIHKHRLYVLFGWESALILLFGMCSVFMRVIDGSLSYVMVGLFGLSVIAWVFRRRNLLKNLMHTLMISKMGTKG